jgi:hypothetical protein
VGFVVHPEHSSATAIAYARISYLSAPRLTSTVKRPSPSGDDQAAAREGASVCAWRGGQSAGRPSRSKSEAPWAGLTT